MKAVAKLFDLILDIMAWVGGIICVFMMLGISADVVARYFLKKPILGMQEANTMLIVWIVFLGSAWLLKKNGHINMDILVQMIRPRARDWLNFIISILCAAIALILFWFSIQVILDTFRRHTLENGNLAINTGYVLLAIPIGTLPLCIQFIRRAYGLSRKMKVSTTEIQRY